MTVYSPGYESWIVIRLSSAAALRDSDQDATQTHIQLRYAVDRSTTQSYICSKIHSMACYVVRCRTHFPRAKPSKYHNKMTIVVAVLKTRNMEAKFKN